MRPRKYVMISVLCIICFFMINRAPWGGETRNQLRDLADVHLEADRRIVYLPENGTLAAYYVICDDYGGNVLLLRKEILPDKVIFNRNGSTYYAESDVDLFLNGEFLSVFPQDIRQLIPYSEVEICKAFPDVLETETIIRQVFLLSIREIGNSGGSPPREGPALDYFKIKGRRIAQLGDEPAGWWLRSTYRYDRGYIWEVSTDGASRGIAVNHENGIRPALCLPADTPIQSGFLNGRRIYVLKIT